MVASVLVPTESCVMVMIFSNDKSVAMEYPQPRKESKHTCALITDCTSSSEVRTARTTEEIIDHPDASKQKEDFSKHDGDGEYLTISTNDYNGIIYTYSENSYLPGMLGRPFSTKPC